ncbi:glutaredoxin [Lichtheimia ornata]|uniref:Glutaredoxin n=1 Tax=Lichtheimia ornata TaxID=688661 RepID=A0AAD7UX12_9FUNG|nr:glutaredoxin [Lichtheimia ornata]KAJ8654227.1 glutaredoxin [Lichtheimia ornata]
MSFIKQGVTQLVKNTIADNRVVVFSKTWCPFSQKAKKFLNDSNIPYHPIEIDLRQDGADIQQALFDLTGQKTVPNIFIDKTHIGGYVDLRKAFQSKKFLDATLLEEIRSSSNTSSSL